MDEHEGAGSHRTKMSTFHGEQNPGSDKISPHEYRCLGDRCGHEMNSKQHPGVCPKCGEDMSYKPARLR